ncbi:hypothetical protein B4U80_14789, partial [Leptotrombidium deliense]
TSITAGPSSVYDLEALREAFRSKTGVKVTFNCRYERKISKTPILTEVYFCINRDTLNPFNCTHAEKCLSKSVIFASKE